MLRVLVWLAAVLTIGTIVFLIGYILVKGVPHIKPSLFAWEYNSENVSLMPALVNTVIMTALSLLIAVPLGLFSAIFSANTHGAATGSSRPSGLRRKPWRASPL